MFQCGAWASSWGTVSGCSPGRAPALRTQSSFLLSRFSSKQHLRQRVLSLMGRVRAIQLPLWAQGKGGHPGAQVISPRTWRNSHLGHSSLLRKLPVSSLLLTPPPSLSVLHKAARSSFFSSPLTVLHCKEDKRQT